MDLLSFLASSKGARKVFGRKELKIIEKQLWGVNLTQSEKNRLSRDIRAKLEFTLEAARFSGEFDLKKASFVRKVVDEAVDAVRGDELSGGVARILLYGSAAERKLTLRSDIDIAVVFDDIRLSEATSFRKRVLGRVNPRVDLQVYNTLPVKIKKEIDGGCRVLYER